MKKYKTGIVTLDTSLSGGIPVGSLILLIEKPGAGADIFSFYFVVEGLRNNERILYIVTDETAQNLLEHIRVYNFNIDFNENMNVVSFISCGENRKIFTYDPLRGLKILLKNEQFDRIVLNNVNRIIRSYNEDEVVNFIEELSDKVKRDEAVAMVELVEGTTDDKIENTLKTIADGIFEFDIREKENEIQRVLKVIKLKRCVVPKNIFRYDITETGIRMESLMRVI